MVSRIAITGGSGMLGSALSRALSSAGHEVVGVDLRAPATAGPGVRHLHADVRDSQAVRRAFEGVDAVVHTAAALPSYPEKQIRAVIVDGTQNVLSAARAAGVQRVVHISSTAVYGLPRVLPTAEDHPMTPVDAYGHAKAEAERLAERFRDSGMCVPVLRPKTFLGHGRMGLFSMLFEWAAEGRNFPVLGRGDVRIQMLAIEDLLEAVATVLRAPADIACDTYNIAAERFGTLREDFQAVLDAAGFGRRVVSVPARPAVAVLELMRRARLSPVYGRLLHKLLADSYVSTDKAKVRLGFTPQLSNSDALLRAFGWWREHHLASAADAGQTSTQPWSQGALSLAKAFF